MSRSVGNRLVLYAHRLDFCLKFSVPFIIFRTPLHSADGEHYLSFTEVYGKDTSEKDLPFLTDRSHSRKLHGMPFNPNAQYARCVNKYIICSECDKPRVLYAARKLQLKETEQLMLELEMVLYTCLWQFIAGPWLK